MSVIHFPPRPTGGDKQSTFMRWVWDTLRLLVHVQDVQGVTTHRTTRGTVIIPKSGGGSGGSSKPESKIPRWG